MHSEHPKTTRPICKCSVSRYSRLQVHIPPHPSSHPPSTHTLSVLHQHHKYLSHAPNPHTFTTFSSHVHPQNTSASSKQTSQTTQHPQLSLPHLACTFCVGNDSQSIVGLLCESNAQHVRHGVVWTGIPCMRLGAQQWFRNWLGEMQ
jgi:hypothetical protein